MLINWTNIEQCDKNFDGLFLENFFKVNGFSGKRLVDWVSFWKVSKNRLKKILTSLSLSYKNSIKKCMTTQPCQIKNIHFKQNLKFYFEVISETASEKLK
jgi:hypothetical protein